MKSKLSETLKAGITVTVDFNPVADRLRVITSDGTNLRVNVDDGKATVDGALKFKDGDANAGKTPNVIAGAYTNSFNPHRRRPRSTTSTPSGFLLTQAPPNDGILNTVGSLGVKLNGATAFNIVAQGEDNAAWLVTGGTLYSVDLKTGKATSGRQARRREGQAHRHRLDRLNLAGAPTVVSPVLPAARRPGPLIGPSEGVPRKVGRLAS